LSETTVLLLCGGTGSRLGHLSEGFNKGLLPLGGKAIISHIIQCFPKDTHFVISVGHEQEKVVEYIHAAHPGLDADFINCDNISGEFAGPGYASWLCKHKLQKPFYIITNDTVLVGKLPEIDDNWIGVSFVEKPEQYCTVKCVNGIVTEFINKEKRGTRFAYTGVAFVKDYEDYWASLEENKGTPWENVGGLYGLKNLKANFDTTWFDTGTTELYENAKSALGGGSLGIPKNSGNYTYKVGNRVIKYFKTKMEARQFWAGKFRVAMTPKTAYCGKNFVAFEWVDGHNMYHATPEDFKRFLERYKQSFCFEYPKTEAFLKNCVEFYQNKTECRLKTYLAENGYKNNNKYFEILEKINWDSVCDGTPTTFHGDLNFGNIIQRTDGDFSLIDWRGDFSGNCLFGDLYYDLGKLWAGIQLNWEAIAYQDFMQKDWNPEPYLEVYTKWLHINRYDVEKVETIGLLSILNMAALHPAPISDFLFNYAINGLKEIVE